MIEALLGELAVAGGTEVVTAAGEHFAEKIKTSTPKNKFLVHSRRMIDHTQGRGGSRCGSAAILPAKSSLRRPTITKRMSNQTSECAS